VAGRRQKKITSKYWRKNNTLLQKILYSVWCRQSHYVTSYNKLWRVTLQKTPLNLLHSFIYDSTSRRCHLSFTMSSDPLMSCLGAVLGSLLSLSVLNADSWLTFSSRVSRCLFSLLCPLSESVALYIECLRLEYKTPFLTIVFCVATIWLLKKRLTVKNCWVSVE
jgi:hypothetical protein